tara:strand:- start:981 stop:1295 length:315 start_codon:yes stop_codon:yes gene_type:complete
MKQTNLFANIVHTIEVNGFRVKAACNGLYAAKVNGSGDLAETLQEFFDMHGSIRIIIGNGDEERIFTVSYFERYPLASFHWYVAGKDVLKSELGRAIRVHGERK